MANIHPCGNIDERCNSMVRKTSCTDCGKIATSQFYTASKCNCGPPSSPSTDYCKDLLKQTTPSTSAKQPTCDTVGLAVKEGKNKGKENEKQTFWQWLLSLLGLGKNVSKRSDEVSKKGDAQAPATDQSVTPQSNALEKARQLCEENKKEVKSAQSPSATGQESTEKNSPKDADRKHHPNKKKKHLEQTKKNHPAKQRNLSPESPNQGFDERQSSNTDQQSPPQKRPPISHIFSSAKYLIPYSPDLESHIDKVQSPAESNSKVRNRKSVRKQTKASPTTCRQAASPLYIMSCPQPCSTCPCSSCCPACPPCQPSVTSLMRKRCVSLNPVKGRSRSCTSPSRTHDNGLTAMRKPNMCSRQKSVSPGCKGKANKCKPNKCPVCAPCPCPPTCSFCPSPCCECKSPCCPKPAPRCPPPSCCPAPPKCCPAPPKCCPRPTTCSAPTKSPRMGSNCRASSCKPSTPTEPNMCPITCMKPCCVPLVRFNSTCPPRKPSCGSPNLPCPKTHTYNRKCPPPTSNSVTQKLPTPCSIFCSPGSLRSYAKSKDNDAYCKYLMSRYNVSLSETPPLCPKTFSGCVSNFARSPPVRNFMMGNNPICDFGCGNGPRSVGIKRESNHTQNYSKKQMSPDGKEWKKEAVAFNKSPSKKEEISAIKLFRKTPVECIREKGPRSPTKEYVSKLGLPNKLKTKKSPPKIAPIEETIETAGKSPESIPSPPNKSPKRGKSKSKKVKIEQIEETVAEPENIALENTTENKTKSDMKNEPHKSKSSKPPAPVVKLSDISTYSQQITQSTNEGVSERLQPVHRYNNTSPCDRYSSKTSSFYRNFLGLSPKCKNVEQGGESFAFYDDRISSQDGSDHESCSSPGVMDDISDTCDTSLPHQFRSHRSRERLSNGFYPIRKRSPSPKHSRGSSPSPHSRKLYPPTSPSMVLSPKRKEKASTSPSFESTTKVSLPGSERESVQNIPTSNLSPVSSHCCSPQNDSSLSLNISYSNPAHKNIDSKTDSENPQENGSQHNEDRIGDPSQFLATIQKIGNTPSLSKWDQNEASGIRVSDCLAEDINLGESAVDPVDPDKCKVRKKAWAELDKGNVLEDLSSEGIVSSCVDGEGNDKSNEKLEFPIENCVYVDDTSHMAVSRNRVSNVESSVDPHEYGSIGESCVDDIPFRSKTDTMCLNFQGESDVAMMPEPKQSFEHGILSTPPVNSSSPIVEKVLVELNISNNRPMLSPEEVEPVTCISENKGSDEGKCDNLESEDQKGDKNIFIDGNIQIDPVGAEGGVSFENASPCKNDISGLLDENEHCEASQGNITKEMDEHDFNKGCQQAIKTIADFDVKLENKIDEMPSNDIGPESTTTTEDTFLVTNQACPETLSENDEGKSAAKPSLLQELLNNSGVKWHKVGPGTDTDMNIFRLAKSAFKGVREENKDLPLEEKEDKNDDGGPKLFLNLLKSENEEYRTLSSEMLKSEEDKGGSIMSKLKDY